MLRVSFIEIMLILLVRITITIRIRIRRKEFREIMLKIDMNIRIMYQIGIKLIRLDN